MKKIKTYILIMMLSLIINIDKINALEVEITDKINSQNTLKECEYSDAYIKWLSLSEEEKQKTIEPFKCKINKKKSLISNIISNSLKGDTSYPDSYSLKDEGEDTPVKNQKETGSCWTFGTTSVIETYMKKKHSIDVDLSERHIEYMTSRTFLNGEINPFGYNREIDDGGNFFIASGYLMHGHGPIAEEDMPFESPAEKIELSELEGKEQVIDVNSITINAGSDCASISPFIKSHLMENGALTANVYMTTETAYYNSTTNAMYYNGDETINHAITIVGWDDNYSLTNFSSLNRPQENGAWLVRNSWGTDWGNDGYFYVSYEDVNICGTVGGITSADTTIPDNYYSHDNFGMNTAYGFSNSTNPYVAYAANVFTKNNDVELLTEVIVGAFQYVELDVYVVPTKEDTPSLDNAIYAGSGYIDTAGYTTIELDEPILLKDEQFTVIVKYSTLEIEGWEYPVGASYNDENFWSNVTTELGRSYISYNGTTFMDFGENISSGVHAVASIKAETQTIDYDIQSTTDLTTIKLNNVEGGTIDIDLDTKYIDNDELLEVKILKEETDVTDKFTLNEVKVTDNKAKLTITVPTDRVVEVGEYNVQISYAEQKLDMLFNIYTYKELKIDSFQKEDVMYSNENHSLIINLLASGFDNGTEVTTNIYDENDTDKTSLFEIENSEVSNQQATINISTIEPIEAGTYTIKITVEDKEITSEFSISEYIPVTSITLEEETLRLVKGEEKQLTATIEPDNAINKTLIWHSSNEEVLQVLDGKITAKKAGESTLTVSWSEDETIFDTIVVTVIEPTAELAITKKETEQEYDKEKFFSGFGGTLEGTITTTNVDKLILSLTNKDKEDSATYLNFKTETNDNVLSFELAIPLTASPNTYCLSYATEYETDNGTLVIDLGEYCFNIEEFVRVEQIDAEDIELNMNQTKQINAIITPTNVTIKKLLYTSNDENIVTVDENGLVTPVAVGETTIEITSTDGSNIAKTINVNVIDTSLEFEITKKDTNNKFDSDNFYSGYGGILEGTITSSLVDELIITLTDKNNKDAKTYLNFETNTSENVLTFALTIPLTSEPNEYCLTYSINEGTDEEPNITELGNYCFEIKEFVKVEQIIAEDIEMAITQTKNISATTKPTIVTIPKLTYTAKDSSILSVDENGLITPIKTGTTTITIKTTDGTNITKTINVTVKEEVNLGNNYEIKAGYIYKVPLKTEYQTLIDSIKILEGSKITIYNPKNQVKTSGLIGTGDKITIENASGKKEYTIVIIGDLNNDGKTSIPDVSKLYNYYTKRLNITEEYYVLASDVNGDNKTSISDVSKIYNFFTGRIKEL